MSEQSMILEQELSWLAKLIDASIKLYFNRDCEYKDVRDIEPPDLSGSSSAYAQMVREHKMSFEERAVLALALAPHLRPEILDPFLIRNTALGRSFTEFGGTPGEAGRGFWPTLETAAFLLAGANLDRRMALHPLLSRGHFFHEHRVLHVEEIQPGTSIFSLPLSLSPECLIRLTTGGHCQPVFSAAFPAHRLDTQLEWSDLVLDAKVMEEVEDIKTWIMHENTLLEDWGLARRIQPGFRSLFHGPPGTGKALVAALLGKTTGHDVYRITLSSVISKYNSETEKSLNSIFGQAQHNQWILFFDEADALFGKRTETSSNDRAANQQVAYLLQRIEDFPGIVILATNLRSNMDEAFARRFQSLIHFVMPTAEERLRLWKSAFSEHARMESSVDLKHFAEEFELSGGAIVNVLRSAATSAIRSSRKQISTEDILRGIRRELGKEDKLT